jgi:flagellar M-ring protein FliF
MADLPAETTPEDPFDPEISVMSENNTEDDQGARQSLLAVDSNAFPYSNRNEYVAGFLNQPLVRQMGLIVCFSVVVALGVMLVLWGQEVEYRPLYANLSDVESSEAIRILEENDLGFKVEPNSGMLLVRTRDLHEARMKLAAGEALTNKAEGYVLLDQEQELGTSQFMETARYRRAIEGELAKTIASLHNVKSARVMLAIPKRSVFVRDNRTPSASVFVSLASGRGLESGQVRAIMHLVSHSVPEMDRKDVSVIDQQGNLLSELDDDKGIGETEKQFAFARKVEKDLLAKINKILEPVIGVGNFKAQVSTEVDFTWVEETEELYNPDLPAVRSEETVEEYRSGQTEGGVPGALSNEPPGRASAPEIAGGAIGSGSLSTGKHSRQSTRNYELDRTISHTRHQIGRVIGLTVAVVVDDMMVPGSEPGQTIPEPWRQDDLLRLTQLVKDAVGFSAARGDRVTVINEPFIPLEEIQPVAEEFWRQSWFREMVKLGLTGLLLLVLVLGVLRPSLKALAGPSSEERMKALVAEQELEQLADSELEGEQDYLDDTITLSGADDLLLPGPGESFARQLDAIKGLVNEDPGRVAQIVKQWVTQESR